MGSFSFLAGFLVVAVVVTLTPGPATAMVIRVAARDGRRAALGTVVGNSIGVLMWGMLSAVGVSSLILASDVAYDVLRVAGGVALIWLGARTWWLTRRSAAAGVGPDGPVGSDTARPDTARPGLVRRWARRRAHWSVGLVTSVSNPKLAVFFVALFPQFLRPGEAVLPAALAMAALIVLLDLLWFSALSYAVERTAVVLRPRVRRVLERVTGSVMVALGLRLAAEIR